MNCSFSACQGTYEERQVVHPLRHHGQVVIFDHVPAEVCSVCGDVMLKPETIRRLERLLNQPGTPTVMAPVYEYQAPAR